MYHKKPDEQTVSLAEWNSHLIHKEKSMEDYEHVDTEDSTRSNFSIGDQIKVKKRGRPKKKDVSDDAKTPETPNKEKTDGFKTKSSVVTQEKKNKPSNKELVKDKNFKDEMSERILVLEKRFKMSELVKNLQNEREETIQKVIKIDDVLLEDEKTSKVSDRQRKLLKIQRDAYLTVYDVLGSRIDDLEEK